MHSQCGREVPLRINMDETSIKLWPEQKAGHLTTEARLQKRSPGGLASSVAKHRTRASISYVCMVCDDLAIQPILPQILFVSKNVVTKTVVETVTAVLPPNVRIVYSDSTWTTTAKMKDLLRHLKDVLADHLENRQVIFSADCFRAHTTVPVWNTCKLCNMYYFIIPAKTTWILQPCDTHVFAGLKRKYQEHCLSEMMKDPRGHMSVEGVFSCLIKSIEEVVTSRCWSHAFRDLGLTGDQVNVSARVLSKIGLDGPPAVGQGLPTLPMLQCIFPANCVIPITAVFGCFLRRLDHDRAHGHRRRAIVTRSLAASGSEVLAEPARPAVVPPEAPAWLMRARRLAPVPRALPRPVMRLHSRMRLPAAPPPQSGERA